MRMDQLLSIKSVEELVTVVTSLPDLAAWQRLDLAATWYAVRQKERQGYRFDAYPVWFGQHLAGEIAGDSGVLCPVVVVGLAAEATNCVLKPQALLQAIRREAVIVAVQFAGSLAELSEQPPTVFRQSAPALLTAAQELVVRVDYQRTPRQLELVRLLWAQQSTPLRFQPCLPGPEHGLTRPSPLVQLPLSWFERPSRDTF